MDWTALVVSLKLAAWTAAILAPVVITILKSIVGG